MKSGVYGLPAMVLANFDFNHLFQLLLHNIHCIFKEKYEFFVDVKTSKEYYTTLIHLGPKVNIFIGIRNTVF